MDLQDENERMRDQLDYVVRGGDPKKLVDGLFDHAGGGSSRFQTPQINNVFDQYSDFQQESAGVKSFRYDGTDEQAILRSYLFKDDTFREPERSKTVGVKPYSSEFKTPDKRRTEKFKSTPMKNRLNPEEGNIGNSYKKNNLPVSPDVIKNNELNTMAFAMDHGTAFNYEGSDREPAAISHIKEKVVRKSML